MSPNHRRTYQQPSAVAVIPAAGSPFEFICPMKSVYPAVRKFPRGDHAKM
jgi:hypothetical protein